MDDEEPSAGDDQTSSPTRRTVLQSGVGALGTSLATSGLAAAESDRVENARKLTKKYREPEATQRVVEKYSSRTASAFADSDRGIAKMISDVNVKAVQVEASPSERASDTGTYLSVFEREGTFTAHITRVMRRGNLVIKHIVQPEADRSYVLLKRPDGTLVNIVDQGSNLTKSTVSTDSVTTSSCETEYTCPPGCCNDPLFSPCDFMDEYKEYCCQGVADGCFEEATGECCDPVDLL